MTGAVRFDPSKNTVGLSRALSASLVPARRHPEVPVDGVSIGVATMSESAPHGGERHPDGDEVLYLVRGRVHVRLETDPIQELDLAAGEGLIVPKGVWHRVDVLEPCQIVYVTPGPNNEHRPRG